MLMIKDPVAYAALLDQRRRAALNELRRKKRQVEYVARRAKRSLTQPVFRSFPKTYFKAENITAGTSSYRFGRIVVPYGYVGFIYGIGTSDPYEGTDASIWIDGEPIREIHDSNGVLTRAIGKISEPKQFIPPYVMRKSIEFYITNTNSSDSVNFYVVIEGMFMKLPTDLEGDPVDISFITNKFTRSVA